MWQGVPVHACSLIGMLLFMLHVYLERSPDPRVVNRSDWRFEILPHARERAAPRRRHNKGLVKMCTNIRNKKTASLLSIRIRRGARNYPTRVMSSSTVRQFAQ
jgi:hypothetical protein